MTRYPDVILLCNEVALSFGVMCRSSTKSIGFLLLLWVGIFLPVTEYQVSHAADLGSLASSILGDEQSTDDSASDTNGQHDLGDRHSGYAGIDLSEFTIAAGPPTLAMTLERVGEPRIAEGFKSRALPPQERPPNSAAA
jgi:hypothetical protein